MHDVLESESAISTKDRALSVVYIASGMLCFGLSFTLFHHGRPILFTASLFVCIVSVSLISKKNRLGMALALVIFLALRGLFVLGAMGLRSI